MEPYRLRRWRLDSSPSNAGYFYTCARPGRSKGPEGRVRDEIVSTWVRNLPSPDTAIISLLGRKGGQSGLSEFSFYPFCGGFDEPSERKNQPTFQEWLDRWHRELQILVREHPTYDFCSIPDDDLVAIATDIRELVLMGRTVVVVDSGGQTRSGAVCKHLAAIEETRSARHL